jgi:predicted phosphodiesterase
MKYAVISDIHSNLEALTKALEVINQYAVDEIICLGDIVGYGANPNECLDLIRQHCCIVLKGNHDAAIIDPVIAERFTEDARLAIFWTSQHIHKHHVSFLALLPLIQEKDDFLFVHASPCHPDQWNYILDTQTAVQTFSCFSKSLCFIGHSHTPMIFSKRGKEQNIVRGEQYIINVGSIGQPRDARTDLSFGIFDTETWYYQNIRCSYDKETAMKKILDSGLPPRLGFRLMIGM